MDGNLPPPSTLTLERRRMASPQPFRRQRRPEERIVCLGASLDFVKPPEVMLYLRRAIAARQQVVVANQNSHSLYLSQRDPEFRAFFEAADLVQVDSMPVILWSRLLGKRARRFHRSTYLDWRDAFWTLAQQEGWRVFYLGGCPGVPEKAAARIRKDYPGAQIAGLNGYFDMKDGSRDNEAVIAQINAYSPDVLMVGMGMPRQELWIARNRHRLDARALLPVGAAFDYEAGVQKPAPRWTGAIGMEWLYRLILNPRRLFSRYCYEPWHLSGALIADLFQRMMARPERMDAAAEAQLQAQIARRGEWQVRG